MSGASIQLRDVRVDYGAGDVLRGISFEVAAGELVALVGPSGCGKSTLLRTINRLVPLCGGRIEINGADIAGVDPVVLRRGIGYAIQAVGLFPHMTVAANIGVVPTLLGWQRPRIEARIDDLLRLVQLEPARYRARKPARLSGGEAQRVGVARALAGDPSVLLMDEPFGAVDALVRRELQNQLAKIVRELSTTTIIVTHDVNEALLLADRIVVLHDGTVEQIASPAELLAHPQTPYVEALVREDERIVRLRAQTTP